MADSGRFSIHRALGAGRVADVLMWKKPSIGATILASATILWWLFERAGYNILTFVANVLLLLVVILFFWAKSASLLNRPMPPLPDMEISEESVLLAAGEIRVWVNRALSVARDIAIGGNLKLFVQIAVVLWVISYVGSFFSFLTLLYIGVVLSLSLPLAYDKYQAQIDDMLIIAQKIIQTQYRKLDDSILRKIPIPQNKLKKAQ